MPPSENYDDAGDDNYDDDYDDKRIVPVIDNEGGDDDCDNIGKSCL